MVILFCVGYLLIVFLVGIFRISMEEVRLMENKIFLIFGDDRWIYCLVGCFLLILLFGMISDFFIFSFEF